MATDEEQAVDVNNSEGMAFTPLKDSKSPSADSGMAQEADSSSESSDCESEGRNDRITLTPGESIELSSVQLSQAAKSERKGPDEVLPSTSCTSWSRGSPVQLRLSDTESSAKPISVITAFTRTVKKYPDHPAFAYKENNEWHTVSYSEYHEMTMKAAKGFIQLGLEASNGVGIIGFNSPEWFISDLGAIFAGGLATGIYTTNSAEACWYVADSARCNVIVVENDYQLQKILAVWYRLPHLRAVVQYRGQPVETTRNVISWSKLIELGENCSDEQLQSRISQQAPNLCCTLIYTSGTTGNPKGVMLSHDNLVWMATTSCKFAKLHDKSEVIISYLPLSHVAAQILDLYLPIMCGGTVYFAQPDALKGTLGDTLKEVRPTSFLGVPRVWEKMQENMVAVGRSQSSMKRRIGTWAKGVGLRGSYARMNGSCCSMPCGWSLANALVFKKVKEALGFDRCRMFMTAAAPIMKETLEYFASLDIQIMSNYGMSENTGPHTLSLPWQFNMMSVGKELPGVSTKLFNADAGGNGEICMKGRHVFMGYLGMEEKTRETIDKDGWLHSGDIGRFDENGYLSITGRIKELIITAGGENVAPVLIEDTVKENLPCVSNCMLVGDARKFLSILLTIKTEVDLDSMEPTSKLTSVAKEFFAMTGSNVSDVSELLDLKPDDNVTRAIQRGIDAANQKAISRAQLIQKWTILPRDFSIPGGEIGPTLKLKRPVVADMYASTINSFYPENDAE